MKRVRTISGLLGLSVFILIALPLQLLQIDSLTTAYAASDNAGGNGNGNGYGLDKGNNGNGNKYSVPEPGTLSMLYVGIGGVMAYAVWRRNRNGSISQ
jgi:PEP-CTERM motif